jgi:hypothetical protein
VLPDLRRLLANLAHLLAHPIEALLRLTPLTGGQGDQFRKVAPHGRVPVGSDHMSLGALIEAKEGL